MRLLHIMFITSKLESPNKAPSSWGACREPWRGHWAGVPGQRGQRDGDGGQVSCDWWTRGHVTPCSPLIGHRGQGGRPLLHRHQAQGLQSRIGQGRGETMEKLLKIFSVFQKYILNTLQAGDQTILSLHKRVITHNDRIHITHDEHNTWNLHIRWRQG